MRLFKILPVVSLSRVGELSKDGLRRLEWMDWYFTHGENAQLTCRHFGLSKSVFYRWKNRFDKSDLNTLEFDTSLRTPHRLRGMTTSQGVIDLVCQIRGQDPEKSKYEIQAELKDLYNIKIGYNTIQKIINRHIHLLNTQHQRKLRKHRNHAIARIKAAKELKDKDLGTLVQIDTKHLYVMGVRYYLFVAVDCKSRYGFVWAYGSCSSKNAAAFLLKVIEYFPFPIQAINTDNGPEYLLNFHKLTEKLNIPHYFNHPHTPQMNSRAERLIQTAEYEFFNYQEDLLPILAEVNIRCQIFNDKYNNKRYHQSLDYQTPASYVKSILERGGQVFSI